MEVKKFRAKSMQEALQRVRAELGPDAAVVQTRELRPSALKRLMGKSRQIEVTASSGDNVPSRLPSVIERAAMAADAPAAEPVVGLAASAYRAAETEPRAAEPVNRITPQEPNQTTSLPSSSAVRIPSTLARERQNGRRPVAANPGSMNLDVNDRLGQLQSMVDQLRSGGSTVATPDLPDGLFELFTDLIEGDVGEALARELVEQAGRELDAEELADKEVARERVVQLIEEQINVAGPIKVAPGEKRLVALVGPTGVGKTTTIAKLAADFRLRQQLRVGLITVDTYRIAAVDQLQTYADIIELPMEVVSTPKEMRAAVDRLHDMDLILMDTAGRSPRDEVRIQELKTMLSEAGADEVHLVLSATTGATNLIRTAERFAHVGSTLLILTKLDEAASLGNVLPLVRKAELPLSYVTCGQNVPDDIEAANRQRLATAVFDGF